MGIGIRDVGHGIKAEKQWAPCLQAIGATDVDLSFYMSPRLAEAAGCRLELRDGYQWLTYQHVEGLSYTVARALRAFDGMPWVLPRWTLAASACVLGNFGIAHYAPHLTLSQGSKADCKVHFRAKASRRTGRGIETTRRRGWGWGQGYIRTADNHRRTPTKVTLVGNNEISHWKKISSGHFWYTNFWVPEPPPFLPLLSSNRGS